MHLYAISALNYLQSSSTLASGPVDKANSEAYLEPSSKNKGQKMGGFSEKKRHLLPADSVDMFYKPNLWLSQGLKAEITEKNPVLVAFMNNPEKCSAGASGRLLKKE